MHDVNNEDFFDKKPADPPRMAPESPLDDLAIQRARERYAFEQKQKELREWFIYQAPPGVYDLYLEERVRILKELKAAQSFALKILIFLVAVLLTYGYFLVFYPELLK